ncbi:PAS domain-containing protein [Candidatus Gracilibacteria bacterium]|nr:PAS domain-containing protein [Candidatus Gracilibacteria bacterium]
MKIARKLVLSNLVLVVILSIPILVFMFVMNSINPTFAELDKQVIALERIINGGGGELVANQLSLITEMNNDNIDRVNFLTNIVPISLIIIVIFGILISILTAKIITKPLGKLTQALSDIAQGKSKETPLIKSGDEIEEFSISFAQMNEKLASSMDSLKLQAEMETEEVKALAKEKVRDRALLSGIGDGIIATDQDGMITKINAAAENMLLIKMSECIGKPVVDIVKVFDEKGAEIPVYKRLEVLALASGKRSSVPNGQTYFYAKSDGKKFAAGITVTPFILQDKIIGTIIAFRDITLEKNIDKAKTEFVSLASHQLRSPITSINWNMEMLINGDMGKVNDEQFKVLKDAMAAINKMRTLIDSLLNISRIELGTFSVDPELVDVVQLAEETLKELDPMIKRKQLNVEKDFDPKLRKMLSDPKLMGMILLNLTSNACKYTPEKGSVKLSIRQKDEDLFITVQDTGCGIPTKDYPQMFKKLFRADNAKKIETEGTGLGLYIIKSVIENAKGKIWFESQEGKGTTFFVQIPLSGMAEKKGSKKLE